MHCNTVCFVTLVTRVFSTCSQNGVLFYKCQLQNFRRKNEAEQKKNEALIRAEQDEKRRRRMEREERRRLKKLGLVRSFKVHHKPFMLGVVSPV